MFTKSLQAIALVALATIVLIDPAFANDEVFRTAADKATDTFQNVRTIVFILGGFGLIGAAAAAIFGKINWKWFGLLAAGLFVVAVAGAVVDYATEDNVGQDFDDTAI